MTVFKGYMRIMKKNTGLILLYLGIFFGVTMALQAAAGKETYTSYESEKIKIGVVDKDNGPLAEGLVKWLEGTHHVTMLEDNREKLQEELFYRNVEYIVVIPEDFYENCMVNGESISVTKVPGSYSAYYVDQQLESCLNTMRTYLKAGFSQKEAATAILDKKRGEVTMLDTDENSGTSGWLYYFRYIPYQKYHSADQWAEYTDVRIDNVPRNWIRDSPMSLSKASVRRFYSESTHFSTVSLSTRMDRT